MTGPRMNLPNGDVLREGDYALTRDGRLAVVLEYRREFGYWMVSINGGPRNGYRADGRWGCDARYGNAPNSLDLVAATEKSPTLWRDMTPEEKGALLLAKHEGEVIEAWGFISKSWLANTLEFMNGCAYRIKPEPKVETVTLYGSPSRPVQWVLKPSACDTHSITLTIRNGKVDPIAQVEKLQ